MAMYIGSVVLLAVSLLVVAATGYGLRVGLEFVVLAVLALLLVLVEEVVVEASVRVSLTSVLTLACLPVLGPVAAGLLALLVTGFQGRGIPLQARIFNSAQLTVTAVLGGLTYLMVGGVLAPTDLEGAWPIARDVGLPLLAADLVQFTTNVLLLAGIVQLSGRDSTRTVITSVVRANGLSYIGYGVIAFVMVVLWEPAGLGPAAAVLVLAPLLVAQWAYRQHADELAGQDRVLHVLVAAVEAKAPHLAGHSARVATLCAGMAEQLGLGPRSVGDVRVAGMLHDLGQTLLPTGLVRRSGPGSPELREYPARGSEMLRGLSFLSGALAPIAQHRAALDRDPRDTERSGRIVGLADEYDLLTEVGSPDGRLLDVDEALTRLAEHPGADDELLGVLRAVLERRAVGVTR